MGELTIEQKAKLYDEVVNKLKGFMAQGVDPLITRADVQDFFPELKESEDDRIRKALIEHFKWNAQQILNDFYNKEVLAWLEKQVFVDEDKLVKGIRRGVAISLMNHIDANSKGMCLSNMECEDIENAIVNEDWDKVYGYMKKKLEKRGEQKPVEKEFTFKAIPRLLDMIPSSERAKSYCGKLSDTLDKEGYHADAKIVRESIKMMNGEKVAMATMDEKKPTIVDIMKNYFATTPKEQQDKDLEELKHLNNFGWEVVEQNPAWSEYDCLVIESIIQTLEIIGDKGANRMKIDFLKSLKDRVQPHPKQEWNEEDKKHIHSIISTIECCRKENERSKVIADAYTSDLEWFKSLMNRCKPSEDLPHWKKGTLKGKNVTGFNSDFFSHNGYYINYNELFDKLPKDE